MKYADLHIHTFYSDSTFSPQEVMDYAERKGLSAIAICDHDCIDGIEECRKIGGNTGPEVISGIEITAEKSDAEIHILGYLMDCRKDWFKKRLKEIQGFRVERIHKMVKKLNEANVRISSEEVFKLAGKGSVGRLHLAKAMLKSGKIKNFKEAFDKYIGFLKPCYVSNVKMSPKEAIEMILKAGGVPILAHPAIMNKDGYIPELIEYGLRGIEVYHTDHDTKARRHYEELAKRHSLLMTGGSDCHGLGKGRVLIGSVRVPYELVEKLKEEAQKGKA